MKIELSSSGNQQRLEIRNDVLPIARGIDRYFESEYTLSVPFGLIVGQAVEQLRGKYSSTFPHPDWLEAELGRGLRTLLEEIGYTIHYFKDVKGGDTAMIIKFRK